ncbi:DUF6176 family protein [Halobacteria archaeon HArc-gm2]|nr:DUF6176 family protein [Halobacteria archaeon HArc-gm2]
MPEVMLARARIEPGREDRLQDWFTELADREPEVVETLQHEGVYTETAFLQDHGDEAYLYLYMEAEDLDAANEAGDAEEYRIDEEHHEILRKTLAGEWEELETVGHFTNPSLR